MAKAIWPIYPKRDTPHLWPPAIRAIAAALASGATPDALVGSAEEYAEYCRRTNVDPRYVKTMARFYSDEAWQSFAPVRRVHGRTREEWARSGQDVAEFDRLAQETIHAA